MEGWAQFWAFLLLISLLAFFVLAVVVSIRGFADIRALFSGLRNRENEQD